MVQTVQGAWRAGRFWWDSSRPGESGAHPVRAVIFDLDSLAEVECGGHRLAFNAAFAAHGLSLTWSAARYRKLLALPDERQRVAAELRARGISTECDVLLRLLVERICATKARLLDDVILAANIDARRGLVDLVTDAFTAGVAVGVVSTGRRRWVDPLVRQLVGDGLIQTIVTADDLPVAASHGAGLRAALAEIGAPPHDALVFTGSPAGLRAAAAAGAVGVLVDPEAVGARADFDGLTITDCQRLHAASWVRGGRSAAA
ncbi:HAD family hydrolase [Mycobacterium yunnanensis]|uniref:HAD family hydrolase n=1 Tax=Mycobacterium yunnanensis TaxID=368477 RepID=A0A9X3C1T4_9MYCO|nr:HAD family hydrolase [Mycobacterium yunnanensis]MCV7421643.1 HAD family hydrolase [Mycobacterium yunnanensis]